MKPPKPEEVWAADVVARCVGALVCLNDDGSNDRLCDLTCRTPRGTLAVEVTTAADQAATQFTNITKGRIHWQHEGLRGGWVVWVERTASIKELRSNLPSWLQDIDEQGLAEFERDDAEPGELAEAADWLGIRHASRDGRMAWGSIEVSLELPPDRIGGFIGEGGNPVAEWVGPWMEADRAEKVEKLRLTQAVDREMFVWLPPYHTAPFDVAELFTRNPPPLPTINPRLPTGVSGVWVSSWWSVGWGLRWSGTKWARFRTVAN